MDYVVGNLESSTMKNKNYRKVIFTGKQMQLVLMSLKPNDYIPLEIHKKTDQFFRVESGKCDVIVNKKHNILKDGYGIIVPAGAPHEVINISKTEDLKLYTIYAPPEHPTNRLDKTNPIKS